MVFQNNVTGLDDSYASFSGARIRINIHFLNIYSRVYFDADFILTMFWCCLLLKYTDFVSKFAVCEMFQLLGGECRIHRLYNISSTVKYMRQQTNGFRLGNNTKSTHI